MTHTRLTQHLRTALSWLLDHLPRARPGEQELISYGAEIERQCHTTVPKGFIPAVYEPPEKTTDPTQEVHQLVETGRITALIHTQKLPRYKVHKTTLKPDVQTDNWLLDVEPAKPEPEPESESALSELSQLVETQHDLKAVRERHERRNQAS